jgi:hypothetical protein
MSDMSQVFDKLAIRGMSTKDLVAWIANDAIAHHKRKRLPAVVLAAMMPQKTDIEKQIESIVARYGGKLGGLTRKNLVNEVWREIVRRYKREAKAEGKVLYLYRSWERAT